MPKLRRAFLLFPVISLAIIIVASVAGQVALADPGDQSPLVVVLVDRTALAESEGGADLAQSFVGLISTLRAGRSFAYVTVDRPEEWLGPAVAGEPAFEEFREAVNASLASSELGAGTDLVSALAETYNRFSGEGAAPGSIVYVLTGGPGRSDMAQVGQRVGPITGLFRDSGWTLSAVSLPGTSVEASAILSGIASDTGGEVFVASVARGFQAITEAVLGERATGLLTEVERTALATNEVLVARVSVAPGSSEATLLVFKESRGGTLRLTDPDGREPSAGGPSAATMLETPHVVIWKLTDPTPGQWRLSASRMQGAVSVWHFGGNEYDLVLESFGTVPLNQPSPLIAYVTDGRLKVDVEGARVTARILTPDGTALVYDLNDDGVAGDAVAGDGYFAATIPPVTSAGEYDVELQLSWPQFGHQITSKTTFRAEGFPAMDITPVQTSDLRPGEQSKVATIFLHVDGEPYAASTDELTFSLASNAERAGELEIRPQRLLDGGRAWEYDVFFIPGEGTLDTLTLQLTVDYADRLYTYTADSMVLSSVRPAQAVPPARPSAPAPPPAAPQAAPPPPEVESSGFPWGLLAIPIAVVAVVAAALIYFGTRTRPFGYLYDERNERVVDFGNLRRHPIMSVVFKGAVLGKELRIPGLEGVRFKFSGRQVGLVSRRATPTVRINNQPLIGDTTIQDRTRIGTHGRLYRFLLGPPTGPTLEPGVGDD